MPDPQLELIERYKQLIREDGNKEELYKWELIQEFQDKLKKSDDVVEVISNFKFDNLLNWRPADFIKNMKEFKRTARELYTLLYDEKIPLIERLIRFRTETSEFSEERNNNDYWSQDTRCMSVYLAFRYPEKYSIFKDSFYKNYCNLLGVKVVSHKDEKYLHYHQLINDFISNYILKDKELLELSSSTLNEKCYSDKNHRILAQDILYRTLENIEVNNQKNHSIIEQFKNWLHQKTTPEDTKKFLHLLAKEQAYREDFVTSERLIQCGNEYNARVPASEMLNNISIAFSHLVTKKGHNISKKHKPLRNIIEYQPEDAYGGMPKTHYRIMPKFVEKVTVLLDEYFLTKSTSNSSSVKPMDNTLNNLPLNKILYGPPGTGKTFQTIDKAIEILLGSKFYKDNQNDRIELKRRYEQLKADGQIEFVTFHQSYGYEEFVEGIRVETNEAGEINYDVRSGILKKICEKAGKSDVAISQESDFERLMEELKQEAISPISWKTKTGQPFQFYYSGTKVFWAMPGSSNMDFSKKQGYPASIENIKKEYLSPGSTPFYNTSYVRGILDYMYKKKGLNPFAGDTTRVEKPYLLIIDEINRGNISKIFGELITLIEESKRIGSDDSLYVTLPYSSKQFGIPKNLYILGTMNSSDRSIALLDTALRRRFHFEEIMPKPGLLKEIEGINLAELLKIINKRIEYLYDRDHCIGHAYLIDCKTFADVSEVFLNKILPLLQEYFYDDWEKINMVFGDNGFITPQKNMKYSDLFNGKNSSNLDGEKVLYEINSKAFADPEEYRKIYNSTVQQSDVINGDEA